MAGGPRRGKAGKRGRLAAYERDDSHGGRMRTPLQDTLVKNAVVPTGEKGGPAGTEAAVRDPGRQLAVLFEAAQRAENQFAAERLSELHQLAERALTLGTEAGRREARPRAAHAPWPSRIASVAAGGLLAACAPIVADASVLLAAASGLGALAALVLPFMRGKPPVVPVLEDRSAARLEAVASAADRALQAMVEPRALPAPTPAAARPDDDVIGLLQDALSLRETDDPAAKELAENAARLARHMGYEPAYDGAPGLFETMIDPSVEAPLTLRPALVHKDPNRTVAGVRVRSR